MQAWHFMASKWLIGILATSLAISDRLDGSPKGAVEMTTKEEFQAALPTLSISGTTDQVINAVESTNVAFTVTGVEAGATGIVTFTDVANHQIVVSINSDGTYSADFSTLTDGLITSSLSVTNLTGSTTTAAGNAVSLDTDTNLSPTFSINAFDPSNVAFTISGLEGDESGTVIFTDSTGQQVVVDVGSNGNYTADLSALKNGTITYLVTVTDPFGNVISFDPPITLGPAGYSSIDGAANAVAGTPQLPHLLDAYGANRPPWQVAGVDYAVGPQYTPYKDPATISMAGVSVNSSSKLITVTGANVSLDGYDFSLGGGWAVVTYGANTSITNSKFVMTTATNPITAMSSASGLYVGYCSIDGGGKAGFLINSFNPGATVIEYNWFKNPASDIVSWMMSNNSMSGSLKLKYNLIENATSTSGQHPDLLQTGAGIRTNVEVLFNTVFVNNPPQGTQGFIVAQGGLGQTQNAEVAYNTAVSVGASLAQLTGFDPTEVTGPVTIHDNYLVTSYFLTTTNSAGVKTGNINMGTGVAYDAPSAPSITSFSPDSGTVGDNTTNTNVLTLSGIAQTNSTVKVYDGATLLGTATANSSGIWTLTTSQRPDGAHAFSATATNSKGTSATSSVLSVTVDTVAPNAPVVVSNSINGNVITLTGTAEANSTVKVLDGATQLGTATANGSGAWSFTTAPLLSGSHSLTATATDAAGNTGAASQPLGLIIGSGGLAAPTFASFSTDSGTVGDGITNDNTLTLTGTAAANATIKFFDGATQIGSTTANGSGAWSYTTAPLSNAPHSLTATATDASGNTSAASAALVVTIDTMAPVAPTIASFSTDGGTIGDGITNDNTLTLTGTAEANATVKVFDGATQIGTATANGSGAWTYTTAALSNGAHTLTATATDAAGNASPASAALAVTIDTTAPTVGQVAASPNNIIAFPGDTIVLTLTMSEAVLVSGTPTLSLNSNGTATYLSGSGSNTLLFSYTVSPSDAAVPSLSISQVNLPNGATVQDAAGNSAVLSGALTGFPGLEIDPPTITAPVIVSYSTDSGSVGDGITNDSTLTLTGTAEANSMVKVFDGVNQIGTATANASSVERRA
jgi:hypothetical protein